MKRGMVFLGVLLAAGCAARPPKAEPARVTEIRRYLSVPPGDGDRLERYAASVASAELIVKTFAKEHGWERHLEEPLFNRVEIFRSQEALWGWLTTRAGIKPDSPMPTDGLIAGLEFDTLLAVRPEEAKRIRPEYFDGDDEWTRLLAHEMAHQLHLRVLDGNDKAMGPQWFYEGFAVIASGQRLGTKLQFKTVDEAFVHGTTEGRGAYGRYAAAVRFWTQFAPLDQLVEEAGEADFETRLKQLAAEVD